MNNLLTTLHRLAQTTPQSPVIEVSSSEKALGAERLLNKIKSLSGRLQTHGIHTLALYADNGPGWIVTDLACQLAGVHLIPLPLFFSAGQLVHVLDTAGVDALLTDRPDPLALLLNREVKGEAQPLTPKAETLAGMTLWHFPEAPPARIPEGTDKITFTSGSTGDPKGVCLSTAQQLHVAQALADAIDIEAVRHLCLLPLSTLLENIGGVYAPLLSGGCVVVPSLADLGMLGSSGFNPGKLLRAIKTVEPNSLILLPQLLSALVAAAQQGWRPPASLAFMAVGGGKVAPGLIGKARALGMPVYEGYGLSECASVVSLNCPGKDRPGSVGTPLPHLDVSIEAEEFVVRGNAFLGYINEPDSWYPRSVRTGDLGRLDDDGFLTVHGRRKHLLISSFGRNINPEWVESELLASPLLSQAVVFGDARPCCVALLYPTPGNDPEQIADWVENVNSRLPDYAQVRRWHSLSTPLSATAGLLTDNGRPRRRAIAEHYRHQIDQLYPQIAEAPAL